LGWRFSSFALDSAADVDMGRRILVSPREITPPFRGEKRNVEC